jgi:hypothetical protein
MRPTSFKLSSDAPSQPASAGFLFTIRFGGFFVHYRLRGFLFTVSLQIGAGDIGNGELKQMSLQLLHVVVSI